MTQLRERPPPPDPVPCCASCQVARLCLAGGLVRAGRAPADTQAQLHTVRLRKRQSLYLLGDPVGALYAIRVGTVKTHVTTEDGRTQVVGFHFPGDMVGLDSLARPQYVSYATALEDTKLCRIPVEVLRAASAHTPALGNQLFLALDRQAQRARALQTMLALMTAEERLVTFLLWLADGTRCGPSPSARRSLSVRLRQSTGRRPCHRGP
ncbi:Crp/Fnr family transcriptional regulator [Cupriavidus necator]|uniref:Crp/Fnr family transcriptional regulator n=1 Tax=Cupriavidus necator TaxID=106590 RepID=UPI0009B8B4C3|nr:cyclic nucleotide-binding domain-containing protein [Cupriavidus necator]